MRFAASASQPLNISRATTICALTLDHATASCALTSRQLKADSYPLHASYGGSTAFKPFTSPAVKLTISK